VLSGAGPCVGEASLGMMGQPIKSRTAILQVKRTPYYPCMLKPINTCHQGSMGHSRGRLDCIHIPDRQPRVGCIRHLAGLEKKESQRIGYGKWKSRRAACVLRRAVQRRGVRDDFTWLKNWVWIEKSTKQVRLKFDDSLDTD
jgi:hypothetical protein